MAGPVYYSDDFVNKSENALPAYFDGKLFIYDWIRGWIFAVTMNEKGDFGYMESFMGDTKFNSPMDMEVSSTGVIYMLEYGNGWYSQNSVRMAGTLSCSRLGTSPGMCRKTAP